MKSFTIGQVLSVATGKLMCDISEVYDILNYMTGDNLFTHQLPRACRICGPEIVRQHPELAAVNLDYVTRENWRAALQGVEKKYGNRVGLEPLPIGSYIHKAPLQELSGMVGRDRVIVVKQ